MATHGVLAPVFTFNRATVSLRQVWTIIDAMIQARRTRRLLTEMDGRLLADIGASRAEASTEANRPFWDYR